MKINFKKTYKFALNSALFISLFSTVIALLLIAFLFRINFSKAIIFGSLFFLFLFLFSFILLQYRVERIIYRRVKKIYDEVSLLESSTFINNPVTTDMETITKEVKNFATNKKLEIEMLQLREEYRREFLGNVSHELKTPLFTVQGYISTLLDGAMKDKIIRKKYLKRAEKGVERLIYIVEDLDMISKLEVGDLRLEIADFDIVEVIQNVFDLFEMKADKKKIKLEFDNYHIQPIIVNGDRDKIQQVIENLIVNAIKYGKTEGNTTVAIDSISKNKILVRIQDDGEGIEKQNLSRIFERFYRVNKSGSRSEGGSGLGLSIVKHIIEGHHQKIYVKSEFGIGSEFSFTLNRAK